MILEVKTYTIICDKCRIDIADTDDNIYTDKEFLEEIAVDEGWSVDKNEHICPKCLNI